MIGYKENIGYIEENDESFLMLATYMFLDIWNEFKNRGQLELFDIDLQRMMERKIYEGLAKGYDLGIDTKPKSKRAYLAKRKMVTKKIGEQKK